MTVSRLALAALAAGLALDVGRAALAADPAPRADAAASYERAERAAQEGRFAEALAAYRDALAADPGAPAATAARARIGDLEAHAEGGFAPLARLDEVRRDPRRSGDRAEILALERALGSFPGGRVRAEARLFVAEAWRRLGEPARALPPLEAAVADDSADRLTRALALAELCALRQERGELREALAVVERDPALSPAMTEKMRRLTRRERLRGLAALVLGGLGAVGMGSIATLAKRARDLRDLPALLVRPLGVAFALGLGGAGALLARAQGGDARPFVWLGLGVLAVGVVARAFRLAAGGRRRARAVWAAACVAGVVAVAFLAAERTDAAYLDPLGL